MSHLRIRKFNARDSYPGLDMDNDLCQAVRAGDTRFTCAGRSGRLWGRAAANWSASATRARRPSRR